MCPKADADRYQQLLTDRIVPGTFDRDLAGLRSLDVLRREHADEDEFVTAMTFEDRDEHSQHYDLVARFEA